MKEWVTAASDMYLLFVLRCSVVIFPFGYGRENSVAESQTLLCL